jgi:hypothetical protein
MINELYIKPIERTTGNSIIKREHYSHSVTPGTKWTLGVFYKQFLYGVIQLGKGVQPKATMQSVKDTKMDEWLELNRFWLHDDLGKNAESKVLSLMFKWIAENDTKIKWLVSFADGMMGKVGTIYQATNWIYTGFNKVGGMWLTNDGRRLHNLHLYFKLKDTKRETIEAHYGKPLYRVSGGQYRYFYFIKKEYKKDLVLKQLPYPKKDSIRRDIIIRKENWVVEDLWDEYTELLNKTQPINTFW